MSAISGTNPCLFTIINNLWMLIWVKLYIENVKKKEARSRIILCISSLDSQSNQSLRNKGTVPLSWPVPQNRLPVSSTPSKGKYYIFLSLYLFFFRSGSAELILAELGAKRLSLIYQTEGCTRGPSFIGNAKRKKLVSISDKYCFWMNARPCGARKGTESIHHLGVTPYHMTACYNGKEHFRRPPVRVDGC